MSVRNERHIEQSMFREKCSSRETAVYQDLMNMHSSGLAVCINGKCHGHRVVVQTCHYDPGAIEIDGKNVVHHGVCHDGRRVPGHKVGIDN